MPKDIVKRVALYRWRFIVGYGVLALLFMVVLLLATLHVPGGLTAAERSSAVTSVALTEHSYHDLMRVNIPYYLLQKLSIHQLGFNLLSIKLPSMILSFLSALGLVLLLKNWYRRSTSLITAAIMLLSAQFLYIGQQGNATILTIFWSIYIMLFAYLTATSLSRRRYLYAVCLAITIALSLYTPLMLYVLIALGLGAILHPHMRYVIRKRGIRSVSAAAGLTLVLLLPFIISLIQNPSLITPLFIGTNLATINWLDHLSLVGSQLFDFINTSHVTGILSPIFSLPVIIIGAVGIYSLATRRHSVQSYVITTWSLLVIPLFIINPTNNAIIFVPISLLVASGISYILWYWYGLFPKNPYARIAGLLPVAVLVSSLVLVNSLRYFYTFSYNPQQLAAVSTDLKIVDTAVRRSQQPAVLIVAPHELAFYQTYIQADGLPIKLTTNPTAAHDFAYRGSDVFATHDSQIVQNGQQPLRIITNSRAQNSDRLYIYKNTAK